jgi:hypothetical protein
MAEKKEMSYVVAVSNAIEGKLDEETIAKLVKLKASLEKRSASKSGKPTKAQIANAELAEKIVGVMEPAVEYAIADVRELVPELAKAPSQKIAPLMKILEKAGKVVKTEAKGKVSYHLS